MPSSCTAPPPNEGPLAVAALTQRGRLPGILCVVTDNCGLGRTPPTTSACGHVGSGRTSASNSARSTESVTARTRRPRSGAASPATGVSRPSSGAAEAPDAGPLVMSHFAAIGVPGILGPTKTRSGQLWSERGGVAAYLSYPGLSSKDPTAKNHSTSSAVYFRPPVLPYWLSPSAVLATS